MKNKKEKNKSSLKRELSNLFKGIFSILWFFIRIPYFIALGIIWLVKKIKKQTNKTQTRIKRKKMCANYSQFNLIKTISGNFDAWEGKVQDAESTIGLILGARGTGKTAFGLKTLENIYSKKKKRCYAMGFDEKEMPSWIKVVENVSEIENDSLVLIDEGGILFSSRRAMTNANKILSELILIARHKGISILFISQNSSNLEVNAIRQADYIALKPSSLLQKDFERKKIKEIYESTSEDFRNLRDKKGLTYIYSEEFRGFVTNSLPSFWTQKISKSFR
ncbi:MAG TPA: zonular occludens toxin domain-containing protein [Candidatus Pacearchaeota archaeon]|nr:zonular occludens toxin domain-containing protein [Candidatus Pacearchaeota archaeon]